ncbi:MAG: hypothetical protein KJ971_08445 [Firmicutes bacterium]|nr:hypothetical protein [Bacillota bacterium]
MNILKNKKGMGLPLMIAIVTFVFAIVATLLTVAIRQASLIDNSIESSEKYVNAVQKVDATIQIIVRDQNLEPTYLNALSAYMEVTIESIGTNLWMISQNVSDTKTVLSYITGSATSNSTYDLVFQYSGTENDFNLSPLITPSTLLGVYIPSYIETNFPLLTPQTEFTTFDSIVSYIQSLTTTSGSFQAVSPTALTSQTNPTALGHWYVTGSVIIPKDKDLTVPNDRILVINGNLTMNANSDIIGNVVVNGNVVINGTKTSSETISGTLYIDGTLTASRPLQFGTSSRPAFIIATGDVTFGNTISGYVYFFCDNFNEKRNKVSIIGGVYAATPSSVPSTGISINSNLDTDLFYSYGIPLYMVTEGSGTGTFSFKYTYPS